MRKYLFLLIPMLASGLYAQEPVAIDAAELVVTENVPKPSVETVISSSKLTFDQDDRFALFEGSVFVNDPQMQLKCDKLLIRFEESGKVNWLEALGAVTISQDDKRAVAERLTHDVESGEFVLTGSPKVYRGQDVLQGDTIRFWRGENRMVCEPKARLTIQLNAESVDKTILKGK
jgi:lipopolysaccharide export system protein LptA